ncbi:MAG: PAS domain-containing sensor histidine kinase [Phycisphaerales bacterium]
MPPSGSVEAKAPLSGAEGRAKVSAEDLADLVLALNAAAGELETTHEALRAEVARLKGELNEANLSLERSRRLAALGEMAAGIAHEVRNPLAAIALHAEMLREDLGENEQGDTAGKILRAARELDGIVGDVLRFARELTPAFSLVGADEPAQRAASTCQMMAEAAGVTLKVSIAAETEPVEIDAGLMAQALANLVRNAVEAIAEEGANGAPCVRVITRSIEADGREAVEYAVEDNGPGVPDGTIERMFNPFYTTRQTGCGLGLAMVQRIVDAHGGSVEASSVMRDGIAVGARFVLRVPLRASGSPSMNESLVSEGAA